MPAQLIIALYTDRATSLAASLPIAADLCDPPRIVVDKDRQLSSGGRRSAATVFGRWTEGRIRVPYVAGADRVAWRAFLESIAEDERFTLDLSGLDGYDLDNDTLQVFSPDAEFALERIGVCDQYRTEFSWRETD